MSPALQLGAHDASSQLRTQKSQVSLLFTTWYQPTSQYFSLTFPVTPEGEHWKFLFFFFLFFKVIISLDSSCQHISPGKVLLTFQDHIHIISSRNLQKPPQENFCSLITLSQISNIYFPVNCLITVTGNPNLIRDAERKCIDLKKPKGGLKNKTFAIFFFKVMAMLQNLEKSTKASPINYY